VGARDHLRNLNSLCPPQAGEKLFRKKKDYQEETKYALELENWAVRGHIVTNTFKTILWFSKMGLNNVFT